MRITVFGATGVIGQLAVQNLLDAGHGVTAYVRNPDKAPTSWTGRVQVVTGEITDAAQIDRAVAGSDAVISTLGPMMTGKAEGLPLVVGARHIVAAMLRHGVRRIVTNGTPSWRHPDDGHAVATWAGVTLARVLFPRAYREMVGMSRVIADSGLEWTIVRFLAPKDGPAKGNLRVGTPGKDKLGAAVTRADIAAYTVAQLDNPATIGAAPQISN